jgi:hypothetical protein
MRRHLTYANIAATLALVFAMTGGALAAKHYLVNSTSQINPKVLKKLRGAKGATGAKGAQGIQGAPGAPGAPGGQGPIGPSNVFSAFKSADTNLQFKGEVVRLTVDVPAGSYLVTGKMQVINTTPEQQKVTCEVTNTVNEVKDESTVTVEPEHEAGRHNDGQEVPVVEAAATLAAAGHWELECAGSASSGTLRGRNPELIVQQVGAVSRTGS